jgi:hypothetical protein
LQGRGCWSERVLTPIHIFFGVFVVVFVLGCLFGLAVLSDSLVYRDLQRRLREERERRAEK